MFLQHLERFVQEYVANIQDDHARIKEAKTMSQALTEMASEAQAFTPCRTIQCLPHVLCQLCSSHVQSVSVSMPLLVRMWKVTTLMQQPISLSRPTMGFMLAWIWNRGKARLVSICLTVKRPWQVSREGHHGQADYHHRHCAQALCLLSGRSSRVRPHCPATGREPKQILWHFWRSELGKVLVTGGITAKGSVDRALKGKHYKRGLCWLRLMYEGEAHGWPGWWDKGEPSDFSSSVFQKYESLPRTAYVALEEDADLRSLITNIFTQTRASDMAD